MNCGVLFYSGHGTAGNGLYLGPDQYLTVNDILNSELNNTKVAFFFACQSGTNTSNGYSIASAAVSVGAKASFGYKVDSFVSGDYMVERLILEKMMQGESLISSVNYAKEVYPYIPLQTGNYIIFGDTSVRITDTYAICEYEPVDVPDGWVLISENEDYSRYQREYNGYRTSDKLIYDNNRHTIVLNRNSLENVDLSSIDYALVERNTSSINISFAGSYSAIDEIALVNGILTVVRIYQYSDEGELQIKVVDLQSLEDVTNLVNLWDDIF